jgi:hypothetical protein
MAAQAEYDAACERAEEKLRKALDEREKTYRQLTGRPLR